MFFHSSVCEEIKSSEIEQSIYLVGCKKQLYRMSENETLKSDVYDENILFFGEKLDNDCDILNKFLGCKSMKIISEETFSEIIVNQEAGRIDVYRSENEHYSLSDFKLLWNER